MYEPITAAARHAAMNAIILIILIICAILEKSSAVKWESGLLFHGLLPRSVIGKEFNLYSLAGFPGSRHCRLMRGLRQADIRFPGCFLLPPMHCCGLCGSSHPREALRSLAPSSSGLCRPQSRTHSVSGRNSILYSLLAFLDLGIADSHPICAMRTPTRHIEGASSIRIYSRIIFQAPAGLGGM